MENSSPVVQQPTSIQRQTSEREWSSGLCACFDDLPTCCLVLFCPHCYMCYLYNKEGESCWIPVCGAGILPLRIKHRIMHEIMGIFMAHVDNFARVLFYELSGVTKKLSLSLGTPYSEINISRLKNTSSP
ncbi:hypothetical protein Smp_135250 [Schistosoma mansoni]|uniref:hypothetical protein n=1 Tax=Schistosoma mansoni TaxID=6183 RepID=UPI0001A6344F|nr:hypothetical protein Smp_135250 [Schistosoma mansoni]|eukprot:XP_018655087.1 hypothetical protein Smp_135250 [Schistosoma mansoni]